MKYKGLIITASIFFLLINTTYFWEGQLGPFAMVSMVILGIVFIGLAISLLIHLSKSITERFKDKNRLLAMALTAIILCTTWFFPGGLIDFDKFTANNVLIAVREGSANCYTTIQFKANHKFIERIGCFGVYENKGGYELKNDTIYFTNVQSVGQGGTFYQFALIKPSIFRPGKNDFDLVMYKDRKDTSGYILLITKNELRK